MGEQVWDDSHNRTAPNLGTQLNRFAWKATSSGGNAAAAIDNDVRTQFAIANASLGNWFAVDLGAPQSFNRIVMDSRKAAGSFLRDYQVYVSNSANSKGKLVASVKGNAMARMQVTFPTQKARYIRIVPQRFAKKSKPDWSFAEFLVYRPGTERMIVGRTELNSSKWQASASRKGTWDREAPDMAIDRNPDTRYTSGEAVVNGDWFQVDMRSPQPVRSIVMNAGASGDDYPTRFEVYIGNNPNKFGKPVYQSLGSPVTRIGLNAPARGRYIRVVNKQDRKSWWSIHDFRVRA